MPFYYLLSYLTFSVLEAGNQPQYAVNLSFRVLILPLSLKFPLFFQIWLFFIFLFFCFLGLALWHMEVPRQGVESEL